MMRIGHGYDVHKLTEGRKLILGGVEIPHTLGLLGHSDADVLLHAIMDAMLGALALGDIGKHFPDTDERYKGADSMQLLSHVQALIQQEGYRIVLDPFTEVPGHPDTDTQAHQVLCSHGHFDHCAEAGVELLEQRESPFTIRTVDTCHDDANGALRGPNTIHILSAGGVTVAHLGDLGHQWPPSEGWTAS